ncbi:MAG: 2Fe-2S iron-sulfur cluster binding domain-containing protein [Bacteroidetes bacterium]|nr:2Fe-2S iron-sulfur cluster binding domain-containing protein [Bacteroidota bacterium]
MSSLFHLIRVKDVIRETPDASTIVFDIPEHLKGDFTYQAGQYVTVNVKIQGQEERRAYSFSSSPFTDLYPAITVKKVADGKVSPFLNDHLKAGDMIELMPPLGRFTTPFSSTNKKHYMLFGGGSGITPVMSIMKSVLNQEPESKVTLVYANRDEQSIIFHKELESMLARNPDRLHIFHCLENGHAGFNGFVGRPTVSDYQQITRQLTQQGLNTEYFICGPGGMMDAVKRALLDMNISEDLIHTEYFTQPITHKEPVSSPTDAEEEFEGTAQATVLFNGKEFEIEVPEGVTILEAAKDQDVDPPYACQMGVCTTCRAKLLEGSATMDEREGLSDAEIAEGYILTCQAHPTASKIKLIYE